MLGRALLVASVGVSPPLIAGAQPPPAPEAPLEIEAEGDLPESSRLSLTLGTDITNAYYFRGFLQEDSGLIVQPWADLAFDIYRAEDVSVNVQAGSWNSFHGEATDAGTSDDFVEWWYEADVYAGMGATVGPWSVDALYYFFMSPSDAFGTIDEFTLAVSLDDSEWMGAWALNPTALLAIETGSNATDGFDNGVYLELGIEPRWATDVSQLRDVEVSFPLAVGLSLSDYYEGENGEDDVFGYVSFGATVTIPLGGESAWGAWALTLSVQGLYLGDAASSFNDNDDIEAIGAIGISASF